ncbi:DUF6377 domain-containing protein [Dysgonomonas sp.]
MRIITLFSFLIGFHAVIYCNTTDSLLNILDESLTKRDIYIRQKEDKLLQLSNMLNSSKTKEEEYQRTKQIMEEYSYFISDSALYYSKKCMDLATELNNDEYVLDMKLRTAHLLSFPQLFHESFKILESVDPEKMPTAYKMKYYSTYIHVYHNQIKDINDMFYIKKYKSKQSAYIDAYLSIAGKGSIEYLRILTYKYYMDGMIKEAARTMNLILQYPDTTPYMHAESLFNLGEVFMIAGKGNWAEAKKYLILASIEYNRLAIKKNPPLMYLARILQKEGNTDRAYSYIDMAMEDAKTFSNNYRHSIAEKTHMLIKDTYYDKIRGQQKSLQYYLGIISACLFLLSAALILMYKHNKILNRTKQELSIVNVALKEQNHIKKIYIGHYLTMYSLYITKLEDYRKSVIRKIKSGYTEEFLKSENNLLNNAQNEIDLLFSDFDNTFLELYPDFVENVNRLLSEDSRYMLKDEKRMNTELRILALLKLGISDNKKIASFLRVTVQTVYNYRSKIKAKAIDEDGFEDEVKRVTI